MKERCIIDALTLFGRCAYKFTYVRETNVCTRASYIKETPKWVNTDNYVLHASTHMSKFCLIPFIANPTSFFIPPCAKIVLLSHSTVRCI